MPTTSRYDLTQAVTSKQTTKRKDAIKQDKKNTKGTNKHILKRENKAREVW